MLALTACLFPAIEMSSVCLLLVCTANCFYTAMFLLVQFPVLSTGVTLDNFENVFVIIQYSQLPNYIFLSQSVTSELWYALH